MCIWGSHSPSLQGVLLGQAPRWDHQGTPWQTRLDGGEQGRDRQPRLALPRACRQRAMGLFLTEVGADLSEHPLLGRCERKGSSPGSAPGFRLARWRTMGLGEADLLLAPVAAGQLQHSSSSNTRRCRRP